MIECTVLDGRTKMEPHMTNILVRHAHIEDCPALASILIAATQDAFCGRVPDNCLNWISPEESAANWAKNFEGDRSLAQGQYLFVAENEHRNIVGLAMVGHPKPGLDLDPSIAAAYMRELRTLQVEPEWQRKGVGRRLVGRVAKVLRDEGSERLLVGVLVENPNRAFYEHLGAVRVGSRPYDWEGYQTEEIVYGWDNLSSLSYAE
jgi:GNAT superfamily N-acetyltransferase